MVALDPSYEERGLLGLAFHPDYGENGRFYLYYSAPLRAEAPSNFNHTSHISEFTVSEDDPNVVDPDSERIVLQVDEPQSWHNAGQIAFGPDGYLYIPLGDGGGAADIGIGHTPEIGNGQDISVLLGSILRIDVDGEEPYGIPPDNPFVDEEEGRDEIYAYGFRNPYRVAFDAGGERQLFVSNVGESRWEEVHIVELGGNYGWNIKEGSHCFDPTDVSASPEECPDTGARGEPLIDPIIEYRNASQPDGIGRAVVGGRVYRGSALPEFQGRYIFGDWSATYGATDGAIFVATPPEGGERPWPFEELEIATSENGRLGSYVLSFGHDADQEVYVLTSGTPGPSGSSGRVYKIMPPSS